MKKHREVKKGMKEVEKGMKKHREVKKGSWSTAEKQLQGEQAGGPSGSPESRQGAGGPWACRVGSWVGVANGHGGQRAPPASIQLMLMHLSKGPQRGHSSKPYYRQA